MTIHLAQYPVYTTVTLQNLNDALQWFHNNKEIFIDLGIYTTFNLPKLHFSSHYIYLITLFDTTDNYNTEYTKWLHIDLAKNVYRATNHRDKYPQMTLWLELGNGRGISLGIWTYTPTLTLLYPYP
jgi:hypothetical protein